MRRAAFVVVLLTFGCGNEPGPPFEARADVKELMVSIVDPAADTLESAAAGSTQPAIERELRRRAG